MKGAGKKVVYIPEMQEAELMSKLFDLVSDNLEEINKFLMPQKHKFRMEYPYRQLQPFERTADARALILIYLTICKTCLTFRKIYLTLPLVLHKV